MNSDEKDGFVTWAYSILLEYSRNGFYGSITFPMQNGVIGNPDVHLKIERPHLKQKPPIELSRKTP